MEIYQSISILVIALVMFTIFISRRNWKRIKYEAEQGNANAQYKLGLDRLSYNKSDCLSWFKLSAEQGHQGAQYRLGEIYSDGLSGGVPKNDQEAAKWYLKSAEQGYVDAQRILGTMCEEGLGMPKDMIQAYKWYNIAASKGILRARIKRNSLANIMTPEQVAEAQKLASEFQPKTNRP